MHCRLDNQKKKKKKKEENQRIAGKTKVVDLLMGKIIMSANI